MKRTDLTPEEAMLIAQHAVDKDERAGESESKVGLALMFLGVNGFGALAGYMYGSTLVGLGLTSTILTTIVGIFLFLRQEVGK